MLRPLEKAVTAERPAVCTPDLGPNRELPRTHVCVAEVLAQAISHVADEFYAERPGRGNATYEFYANAFIGP